MLNVIGQRVLPDTENLAYFETHGMPVNQALVEMSGKWGHSDEHAFVNSDGLRMFQAWLHEFGKLTFYQFLLENPVSSLLDPIKNISQMLDLSNRGLNIIATVLWMPSLLVSGFFAIKKPQEQVNWFCVIFLLLVYPNFFIAWNGDAMEISRHALGARIHLELAVLITLFISLQSIWSGGKLDFRLSFKDTLSDIRKHLLPVHGILSRGLIFTGSLACIICLLFDFFRAKDTAGFHFAVGRNQALSVIAGLVVILAGLILHFVTERQQVEFEKLWGLRSL